jgi:hypothetical protein
MAGRRFREKGARRRNRRKMAIVRITCAARKPGIVSWYRREVIVVTSPNCSTVTAMMIQK